MRDFTVGQRVEAIPSVVGINDTIAMIIHAMCRVSAITSRACVTFFGRPEAVNALPYNPQKPR